MHRPVHNGMEVINRCEIVSEDDYRAQLVEYNARAIRDVQLRQGNTTNDTILGIHQMVLCQRRALLAQAVILHILGYGQAIWSQQILPVGFNVQVLSVAIVVGSLVYDRPIK